MSAPTFTSITPNYGYIQGNTTVTIVGTGFIIPAGMAIRFDGILAAIVSSTPTTIIAKTPAHAIGYSNLSINVLGNTIIIPNAFLYMTVPNFVNFATTVQSRLLAAAAALGGVQQIIDRDEDPAIIAKNAKQLPTLCIIPIGASKLNSTLAMGSDDVQEDFQLVIVGYYRQSQNNTTPYSDINLMREYGKTAAALFSGQANSMFNSCVIYKWNLEIAPYQEMDYVLDRWVLTLFVKSLEY